MCSTLLAMRTGAPSSKRSARASCGSVSWSMRSASPNPRLRSTSRCSETWAWCGADRVGRNRHYRVNAQALRPIHDWIRSFERRWNKRYDRLDDFLVELQQGELQGELQQVNNAS